MRSRLHHPLIALVLLLLVVWGGVSAAQPVVPLDGVLQVSTLDALRSGEMRGIARFDTIRHGFGLGAFADLDGELVGAGEYVLQVPVDGVPHRVSAADQASFGTFTYFESERTVTLRGVGGMITERVLNAYIESNGLLPPESLTVAIRAHGEFESILVRSVPRQEPPYPTLEEVLDEQVEFVLEGVEGTLVGFWTSNALTGVADPGFHYHFVTADGTAGGHVLAMAAKSLTIEVDAKRSLILLLPQGVTGLPVDQASATTLEQPVQAGSIPQTVVRFGARLRHVPLLAESAVRSAALEQAYGGLVSGELLAAWQAGEGPVPGQDVSSPWPDHLAIRSIERLTADRARVEADVVYMSSTSLLREEGAERYPVVLELEERDGVWLITAYEVGGDPLSH